MNTQLQIVEALTNGTPTVIADVCELLRTEATTLSGQPFDMSDADSIDHDAVDRAPIISLIAELGLWHTVAEYLSLEI